MSIRITGVTKRFDRFLALDHVSLEVPETGVVRYDGEEYPFAVIPHPISSDGDLRAKAEDAVRQCVDVLRRP